LLNFLGRLETNHSTIQVPNARLTLTGLELAYELAYLKVFLLWESFQEQVFFRLLSGFASNGGPEPRLGGAPYVRTLALAEAAVLGGKDFVLWHNPVRVIGRSDRFFEPAGSYFRNVILVNSAALTHYAAVRHRVAHSQEHARGAFDTATMAVASRRYPGGSAGKFLRDSDGQAAPKWINVITGELSKVAHQFC
jgi:hypothetical protein